MKKFDKILFIITVVSSVLFLVLFFVLKGQAAACDPVWEIKRHDALIKAAWNFLYVFISTAGIAAIIGGTLLGLKLKEKSKINDGNK